MNIAEKKIKYKCCQCNKEFVDVEFYTDIEPVVCSEPCYLNLTQ